MVELVEFIVKQFIDKKDCLKIHEKQEEEKTIIVVNVDKSDMGKIIGKNGRIAKAIRTLVKSSASKEGKKYTVEIAEQE